MYWLTVVFVPPPSDDCAVHRTIKSSYSVANCPGSAGTVVHNSSFHKRVDIEMRADRFLSTASLCRIKLFIACRAGYWFSQCAVFVLFCLSFVVVVVASFTWRYMFARQVHVMSLFLRNNHVRNATFEACIVSSLRLPSLHRLEIDSASHTNTTCRIYWTLMYVIFVLSDSVVLPRSCF